MSNIRRWAEPPTGRRDPLLTRRLWRGDLCAPMELATGELRGYGGRKRGMADVAKDFMRVPENMKRLAARLAKLQIK